MKTRSDILSYEKKKTREIQRFVAVAIDPTGQKTNCEKGPFLYLSRAKLKLWSTEKNTIYMIC